MRSRCHSGINALPDGGLTIRRTTTCGKCAWHGPAVTAATMITTAAHPAQQRMRRRHSSRGGSREIDRSSNQRHQQPSEAAARVSGSRTWNGSANNFKIPARGFQMQFLTPASSMSISFGPSLTGRLLGTLRGEFAAAVAVAAAAAAAAAVAAAGYSLR